MTTSYKITVGAPIPPKFTDTFVVEVRFMSGDADAYETAEVPTTEEGAAFIAEFLAAAYADRKMRRLTEGSGWEKLPNAWVVEDSGVTPPPGYEGLYLEWPYAVRGDCYQSLDQWSVYWYDKTGIKHACLLAQQAPR
jgi:hypothetical protein